MKWSKRKYLGVYLKWYIKRLYEENCKHFPQNTQVNELEGHAVLLHRVIQHYRSSTLLKLVYTLNAIRFFIFYNHLDKVIKKFIWNNNKVTRERTKMENAVSTAGHKTHRRCTIKERDLCAWINRCIRIENPETDSITYASQWEKRWIFKKCCWENGMAYAETELASWLHMHQILPFGNDILQVPEENTVEITSWDSNSEHHLKRHN